MFRLPARENRIIHVDTVQSAPSFQMRMQNSDWTTTTVHTLKCVDLKSENQIKIYCVVTCQNVSPSVTFRTVID